MSEKNSNSGMQWKNNTEKIFKKWCDHAVCYSWMHDRSYKKFNCHYSWFTIPVIILSTITGTANFAHERYTQYASIITMVIGSMNILAAIITTIAQFCKVSEKVEGHRIAAISWDKFGRNIRIELAKDRQDRMKIQEFMNICSEEYNRLIEVSPSIPRDVIRAFKKLAIANNAMDLHEINDGDPSSCICCDECCFCDNCFVKMFPCCFFKTKGCCHKCRSSKEENQTNDVENNHNEHKIELPEICGNFKPTDIKKTDQNNSNLNKYGLFNMNIESITLDDDIE